MATDFQDLVIWETGLQLLVQVYQLTTTFPVNERYALADQLKRAANAVIANIAEANGRHFFKDKIRVLYQSRGEIEEVKSHLLVAKRLNYGKEETLDGLIQEYGILGRRLNAFIKSVVAD